jgi:hypothetical protein
MQAEYVVHLGIKSVLFDLGLPSINSMFIFFAKTDDFLDKIFVQKKKRKREKTQDIGGNARFWYFYFYFFPFFREQRKKVITADRWTLFCCFFRPQTF